MEERAHHFYTCMNSAQHMPTTPVTENTKKHGLFRAGWNPSENHRLTGPVDLVDHYVSGFKIYIVRVGSRPSLKEATGIWMGNTDLSIWYIY